MKSEFSHMDFSPLQQSFDFGGQHANILVKSQVIKLPKSTGAVQQHETLNLNKYSSLYLFMLYTQGVLHPRRLKDTLFLLYIFLNLIRIADKWRLEAAIIEEVTWASSDALGPPCFLFLPAPFIAASHRRDRFLFLFLITPHASFLTYSTTFDATNFLQVQTVLPVPMW